MVERGHQVTVYNRGGHNVFGKEFDGIKRKEYRGIRIITIPTTKGLSSVPIYSLLATLHAAISRYDCVSYRASGSCVMIPLAKLLGLRVVASLHGIDSKRDKWSRFASKYLEFGEKMAAKKSDVCLVLSNNMKVYIDKKYNINSVIFANGIDKPQFHESQIINDKYGLSSEDYILSLGRIVPEKGIHYLIKAFINCTTEKKLVIAGGSESNKDYYNQLLRLADGHNRIIFTGFVFGQEIQELYSNAYIFALPSNLEGMANSLLEAMSYNNCCLISDIPENTEVVKNNAIWFRKGDVNDLGEKLQMLLDDKVLVHKYKYKAGSYILDKYSWELVVDQMLRVYSGDVIDYKMVLYEHEQKFKVSET